MSLSPVHLKGIENTQTLPVLEVLKTNGTYYEDGSNLMTVAMSLQMNKILKN
jgi:hypothetical protein